MTLSPASENDVWVLPEETVDCRDDIFQPCPVLGIFRKQNRIESIRAYCQEKKIGKLCMSNNGVTTALNVRDDIGTYALVVVFKYAVVSIRHDLCKKLEIKVQRLKQNGKKIM